MLSEEEAIAKILERVQVLPPRQIAIEDARGFFVTRELLAERPLPLFDNSAMDGYAVIAADCGPGKRLTVIGEQPAGVDRALKVRSGEAVRIFTGALMPAGANAVVMQEDVVRDADHIVINEEVSESESVRSRGCELSEGQKILTAGQRLRPENLALLAAQGISQVEVGGAARIAILSTGDELVSPGRPIRSGQLYESNSVLLRGLVEEMGAAVELVRRVPDNVDELRAAFLEGLEFDVLIISGGVSVGDRDFVRPLLKELGMEIDLWRVAIKPGKPFVFGRRGNCAVFGLPGNPVSAFITFLIFVRPAILRMMGAGDEELPLRKIDARLSVDLGNESGRAHYFRGRLRGGDFEPVGHQQSHALYGLSRSNALLRLAPEEQLSAGNIVSVYLWN